MLRRAPARPAPGPPAAPAITPPSCLPQPTPAPAPTRAHAPPCTPALQVWFAVKVLEALGQHKSARRLKWGHVAWDAQNSAKTDRNLFFTTKVLGAGGAEGEGDTVGGVLEGLKGRPAPSMLLAPPHYHQKRSR